MKIRKRGFFSYKSVSLMAVGLIAVMATVLPATLRADSMKPDWLNDQPSLVGRYRVADTQYCYGPTINMKISGLSQKLPVCVLSGGIGEAFFGSWRMPDASLLFGFGLPGSEYMYQTDSCASYCAYSFQTDTMLVAAYSAGNMTLRVIPHALVGAEPVDINGQHNFNLLGGDAYSLTDASSAWVVINNFSLSNGGRYAAVSLRSGGEALINLSKMTIRQVLDYNPTGNRIGAYDLMAVSDDGRFLSVASSDNDELVLIDTSGCGADELAIQNYAPSYLAGWCQSRQFSLKDITNDNGARVTLSTRWTGDNWQGLVMGGEDSLTPYLVTLKASNQPVVNAEYLALGDSFTSGEGETDDRFYLAGTNVGDDKCHVSSRSYPFLSGVSLGLPTHSVACSGATTRDVLGGSTYLGQGSRASDEVDLSSMRTDALANFKPGLIGQVEFVGTYHPSLVTIGIGGNDVGMFSKLRDCLMPSECTWASPTGLKQMFQEIDRQADKLEATYRALKSQSPASRIFAVGYPEIVGDSGGCGSLGILLDSNERKMMNQAIDHLDQMIAQTAGKSSVSFIDIRQAFKGHRLCEDSSAMNDFRLGDDSAPISQLDWAKVLGNETFHPTPYGHQLIATLVARAVLDAKTVPLETLPLDSSPVDLPLTISSDFASQATVNLSASRIMINLPKYSFSSGSPVTIAINSEVASSLTADGSGGIDTFLDLPTHETGFEGVTLEGRNLDGDVVEYYQTIGVVGEDVSNEISQAVGSAELSSNEATPDGSPSRVTRSSQSGSFTDIVTEIARATSDDIQPVSNDPEVLGANNTKNVVASRHSISIWPVVILGSVALLALIIWMIVRVL